MTEASPTCCLDGAAEVAGGTCEYLASACRPFGVFKAAFDFAPLLSEETFCLKVVFEEVDGLVADDFGQVFADGILHLFRHVF